MSDQGELKINFQSVSFAEFWVKHFWIRMSLLCCLIELKCGERERLELLCVTAGIILLKILCLCWQLLIHYHQIPSIYMSQGHILKDVSIYFKGSLLLCFWGPFSFYLVQLIWFYLMSKKSSFENLFDSTKIIVGSGPIFLFTTKRETVFCCLSPPTFLVNDLLNQKYRGW